MDLSGDIENSRSAESTRVPGMQESGFQLNSIRVLVVDDSSLMRSAIKRVLNESGLTIEVEDASDGHEALQMVKEKHFDIVFSDIEMPVMDGVEFIKRCKINSDAKIVVLSSVEKLNEEQKQKIRFFGADGVIAKPRGNLDKKSDEIVETLTTIMSDHLG